MIPRIENWEWKDYPNVDFLLTDQTLDIKAIISSVFACPYPTGLENNTNSQTRLCPIFSQKKSFFFSTSKMPILERFKKE